MNTVTDSSVATGSDTTTANIDLRLAQIDQESMRLKTLEEERNRLLREKEAAILARRKEVIQTIPGLLGVASIEEAIALMRGESSPRPSKAGKGHRYSDEIRAQVKAAFEAKTPVAQIAKHFRISEPTLWIWKRAWGLVKTVKRGARNTRVARRPKGSLDEVKHARLLQELKEGHTSVQALSKRYGRSRQRIYQIAEQHHIKLPGRIAA